MSDKIEEIRERFTNGAPWTRTTLQHDIATLLAEVDKLGAENEKLRAEIERLREALVSGSEALASHQGSPGREWHNAGAWLYPGDSINVVRAPLPEIKVES